MVVYIYTLSSSSKKEVLASLGLSWHSSTFFTTSVACLCAFFAVIYVVPFTFLSTYIANVIAQITDLLCKLTVHWHQCRRCPTNSCAFTIDLSTACHHLDILLFEVRCSTPLTSLSASHAGIYAALPFCILERCGGRHILLRYWIYIVVIASEPFG